MALTRDEKQEIDSMKNSIDEMQSSLQRMETALLGDTVLGIPGLVKDVAAIKKRMKIWERLAYIAIGAAVPAGFFSGDLIKKLVDIL